MAAPVYQTDVSAIGAAATSFTPTKPAGTVTGDLLVLVVAYEKGSDVTPTNSQWTTVRTDSQVANVGQRVAWRIENGAALTAVSFSQAAAFAWTVCRISGHDPTTPIDAHQGANNAAGNPDPPSVTTSGVDRLALACVAGKIQTTYTPPSGYTEQFDNPNTTAGIPGNCGATKTVASVGVEDPATFTPGSASEWVAATVAIAPVAGTAVTLVAATETDTAQALGFTHIHLRTLTPAAESDLARPLFIYEPSTQIATVGPFHPHLRPEAWF